MSNRGFTVIELMIVVAITAILVAVAVPSFVDIIARSQVKTAAADLHLSMMRARSEAIKRNVSITVTPVAGGWKEGWSIPNGVETHGAVVSDIDGPASVTYNPNGRAGTDAIAFDVSSSSTLERRCVTISLSGQPIVKPQGCGS